MGDLQTSQSLLERLRSADRRAPEWGRFLAIYSPWLRRIIFARAALPGEDSDDVLQEMLVQLCRCLKSFKHNGRPGAFRCYARKVAVRTLDQFVASKHPLSDRFQELTAALQDPRSELSRTWEREHDAAVIRQLIELVDEQNKENWRVVFHRLVLKEESVDEVAKALGTTVGNVCVIKSRIYSYLRREAAGLIDGVD